MKIFCHLQLLLILIGAPGHVAVKNDFQSLSAQLLNFATQDKATEESGHLGFARWCNGSLASQSKRREDLKRLLEQAMPLAVGGEKLKMLQSEEQQLHTALEQKRTASESARRSQKKRIVDAKLSIEDCSKDLEALQRAELQMSSSNPSASAINVGKMLQQAVNEQKERNTTLKELMKPTMQQSDLDKIEKQHNAKKAEVQLLARQRLAALKSQEVLLAALEDESEYLADLQGLCDTQEQVHGRLQKEIYPILRLVGQKLSVLPVATPTPVTLAAPAVNPAPPPQVSPVAAPTASLLSPAVKPHTPRAKAAKRVLAVQRPAPVVAAAPETTTATTTAAPAPSPPPAPAPAPPPAQDAAPPPAPAHKSKRHHHKRKHQTTTTTTTTATTTTTTTTTAADDDDDDSPSPAPAKAPAPAPAPPVSEKGWKPSVVASGRKKATDKLAAMFDAEDDPDDAPKARAHSSKPAPKPKVHTVLDQVAADFNSDDDDDDSSAKSKKSESSGAAKASPAPAHDDFDSSPSPPPAKHDDFDVSFHSSSSSDEDSPHMKAPRGFEGGWRAMMGKVPKRHHAEKKDLDEEIMDKIGDGALPASYTAWKPDDDNSAPAPPAPAPLSLDSPSPPPDSATSRINQMSADLDSDDDSAPAPPPPPRHHHHHHHSDDDNAPAPSPPSPAVDKIASDLDKENDVDSPAPSPPPVDSAASRLSAGASLDDDDSPAPSPPPPRRHHHHHSDDDSSSGGDHFGLGFTGHHHSDASSFDPEPMTSVKPIRGFEGGWQAMMRHMPAKKHVHKDTDADLMEHLYDNNGALPSSYTAWKPSDDDDKPKASPASQAFAAAAANFDDDDSFLQLTLTSKASMESPVRRMIQTVAEKKPQPPSMRGAIFLEESSTTSKESESVVSSSGVTEETINAAQLVLDMYSAVLDSPPLHQLSLSRLSVSELTDLWHKLQSVDPMTHPNIIAPTGQQAQAERWCQYFEQNQGSAAPQHQALMQWEKADTDISEAAGKRAAILEELEARTQLQRTVTQDIRDLSALLQGVDREYGTMTNQMEAWVLQAGAAGVGSTPDGLALRDSVSQVREMLSTSLTQLNDLINQAVHKRSTVEARQRAWLSQVQIAAQNADKQWLQSTSQGSQWKSALEAAKKNLASIEATCDTALESMERRRHAGRREMRAIRIALLVLDPQD